MNKFLKFTLGYLVGFTLFGGAVGFVAAYFTALDTLADYLIGVHGFSYAQAAAVTVTAASGTLAGVAAGIIYAASGD